MESAMVTKRLLPCDAFVARLSLICTHTHTHTHSTDVYKETSPAHIKGFKLSPQAVAMEITLLRLLIRV